MRFLERYLQLYLAFEQGEALQAWNCWSENGIATRFNDSLPKGEIGVNPPFPGAGATVWRAQTCDRGLLHPVEQLDVAFVPRLADLGMTAMRRDAAGKAATSDRRRPGRLRRGAYRAKSRAPFS
ncbi:hypothetical protein [Streptomyces sp. NPDC050121]|uniref:hypothetical protein n=1 Tax=Streptomyces sp. NPDC050121 TaxID=3365601 RepID=UPI00379D042E